MRLLSEIDNNRDRVGSVVNSIIKKPFGPNSIGNLDIWSYDAKLWDQNRIKLGELIDKAKKKAMIIIPTQSRVKNIDD